MPLTNVYEMKSSYMYHSLARMWPLNMLHLSTSKHLWTVVVKPNQVPPGCIIITYSELSILRTRLIRIPFYWNILENQKYGFVIIHSYYRVIFSQARITRSGNFIRTSCDSQFLKYPPYAHWLILIKAANICASGESNLIK